MPAVPPVRPPRPGRDGGPLPTRLSRLTGRVANRGTVRRPAALVAVGSLVAAGLATASTTTATAEAADAESATLVGDLQTALGCPGNWDPTCEATTLTPAGDGTFAAEFELPAGAYEYKVALNGSWDESYGRDGGDANAPLHLEGATTVRVTYDDASHRIAVTPLDLAGGYTEADDALVTPPVRQPGSDERFYFVMTDRFANGDPSNDDGGLDGGPLETGFDPTNKGFYQGGDLAGLAQNLDYIEGLGTTAIWLTPSFLNRPVQGEGDDVSAGYHGYWITDFTRIDPHLGTNEELTALIDDAHTRGIKVYFDIITNHTADVVDYAEGTYDYVDQATRPYTDADGNPFDPADFAGTGDFPALDAATSFPYTPQLAPEDADLKVPAWLNDPTLYHNRGNSTWEGESVTYGDFSGLDDLMTEHPTVVDGMEEIYKAWIDLGIDGFRIDTAKHVNFEFWEEWSTEIEQYAHAQGKDEFFTFGEVFDADAAKTSPYVRDTDMSSVLDFAFQSAATSFASGNSAKRLVGHFASDDRYTTPDSSATALPTFLGNHDMGRVGYMLAGTDNPLERDELAHELMYLTRGQPVVYYGDEQGFAGTGGDKDARQTLFATQVDEYANQPLVTGEQAGSQDRYDTDAPLYEHIAALAALREEHPALATGAQIERFAEDGAGIYAFSRVDRTEKVEHLVALNNAAQEATASFTTLTPGASYGVLYDDDAGVQPVSADANGEVALTVPARSAVVLVADRQVDADTAGTIAVAPGDARRAGAAVAGTAPVAAVVDDAWAETSFAWRAVGTDEWHALGTAEDTDPRVFHDVSDLPEGTLVEYRAVTRDADGDRAAASSYGSVGVDVSGVVDDEGPGDPYDMVTVPGSHNSEMGCAGDWTPDCEAARLTLQEDGTYAGTFEIPAGSYEFKIAVNGSWAENYGADGERDGANIPYSTGGGAVRFTWDPVTKVPAVDPGEPGTPGEGQMAAHWVREGLVLVPSEGFGQGDDWRLIAGDGDAAPSYTMSPGDLPADVAEDVPHLAGYQALEIEGMDPGAAAAALRGALRVERYDAGGDTPGEPTAVTGVQLPGVLDDLFATDRELGAVVHPNRKWASFALWAPTARDVDLLVWPRGRDLAAEPDRFDTERRSDGAWTLDGKRTAKRYPWYGARYRYAVEVYVPETGQVETNVVTDPYSLGLTLDSTHSVVVSLDDKRYQPRRWRTTPAPVVERPVDQTIYELHVRDFSIADETVPERLRGTYGAFEVKDSDGMTHLRELADAGITGVHLLPTFDIATIPEDRDAQATTGDLSGFAPDGEEQQAAVAEISADDGFNWGYDPYHFTTPEGSYARRADGGARIAEFRGMVGALHDAGLQVILDQVFNHTSASGQADKSVLDRVVPGYYHRQNPVSGDVETSTCCQNLATEHAMGQKLMVDSVVTWARDYRVDGFRFDLMGHHSKENMLAVRAALDALTVEDDGVDGSAVYLYGEGWDFGEVAGGARFEQATQGNLGGTGIGTFSDRLRDAMHGGSPVDGSSLFQQGVGTGLFTDPNGRDARLGDAGSVNDGGADEADDLAHQMDLVKLGLAGNLRDYELITSDGEVRRGDEIDYRGSPAGYADSPEEVITYVDAHDNETLFDLLALKLPADTPMDERVRMNTVNLATTALAQTPSFWHAGTDLLRSKSLDRNSYDSGDWFNAIDWSGQDNGFGRGLPMAADNEDTWPYQAPLLADPGLKPSPEDVAHGSAQARELLELRGSTDLLRLGSADLIQEKVTFPGTAAGAGAEDLPGVIAMSIDDLAGSADVDPALDGALVVVNASPDDATVELPELSGRDYALSPVQADGVDDVVRRTGWDAAAGTATVPARTVAVLVDPAG
ncbi:pullulanase-type alpha-1,6-glucosidase [Myceligenerans pegani]|uniref:Pullulanase-type alpha-1,6-glucosidase n=1 Tax=Myceligenerans pegani TaxID=2776917 RepID=A0ABR9MUC7_9MICO|nr:pullulanase-type alpha-1,6-glucosidase [Myceligenerans sp. TRM 65318]MBE1874750.1 pullulanase-type alpha-1,6-glucosidase [Myceligenerans sp. TRM 65318]MBE3017021.1 pullulanase-type alpha-1,6-glucosidase [Myceligenerans sp. TRM 65318]